MSKQKFDKLTLEDIDLSHETMTVAKAREILADPQVHQAIAVMILANRYIDRVTGFKLGDSELVYLATGRGIKTFKKDLKKDKFGIELPLSFIDTCDSEVRQWARDIFKPTVKEK
jgi:bacterioferritin (cytochrome b1)